MNLMIMMTTMITKYMMITFMNYKDNDIDDDHENESMMKMITKKNMIIMTMLMTMEMKEIMSINGKVGIDDDEIGTETNEK